MNDDLGKKIQQIAELLGQDNMPDNVKELVALLASSMAPKKDAADTSKKTEDGIQAEAGNSPIPASDPIDAGKPDKPAGNITENSSDIINAARNALSEINAANDPRINLLNAIKPFMNSRRQKKISSCIQLLRVASLSRLLNEQNGNR